MKIFMVTPAGKRSLSGNRATAVRWWRILKRLGHTVEVDTDWHGEAADMMIALHAWRSAAAIKAFKARYPTRLLILALTGTDLYRFIHSHPVQTLYSIDVADRLVALHDLAYQAIPEHYAGKLTVIKQSAVPIRRQPPRKRTFDFCVSGHLREEKDALRPAFAARRLPQDSRIRILHYGKAHSEAWAEKAKKEMAVNPRYRWYGEVPHWKIRQVYARSRAMILPSNMEGGANVVSEAVMADLPVLASDIDGSVGLLGRGYAGYYPVGDEQALSALMLRAERDKNYLASLIEQQQPLKAGFTEEAEFAGWARLLGI